VTLAASLLAVVLAAFVKGAVAFGFPTIATPLVALVMDVKRAVAILILPNLVMDGVQAVRRPGLTRTLRRHAALVTLGIAGTFVGTHLLRLASDRQALLALGLFVVLFAVVQASGVTVRVAPGWERYLAPPVGFAAGVVGGVTNVPGTPLVLYFYALGLDKDEFVRSVAVTFLVYKAAQLVAVTQAGLMTGELFGLSVLATGVALGAFRLGLAVQDRMAQRTFNRVVLGVLAGLGIFLTARALG
jgi:hypothetical protein